MNITTICKEGRTKLTITKDEVRFKYHPEDVALVERLQVFIEKIVEAVGTEERTLRGCFDLTGERFKITLRFDNKSIFNEITE